VAWLEKIETGSILIKEKCKHLSKMSDRVSTNIFRNRILNIRVEKSFIEVYINNQSLFVIIYREEVTKSIDS